MTTYQHTTSGNAFKYVKCHGCNKELSVPADFQGCIWCEQCQQSGDSQYSANMKTKVSK